MKKYNYSDELVSKIENEYGKDDRISTLAREGSNILDEYIYSNLVGINQFILHSTDPEQISVAKANMARRRQLYNAVFEEQIKEDVSKNVAHRPVEKSNADTSRVR